MLAWWKAGGGLQPPVQLPQESIVLRMTVVAKTVFYRALIALAAVLVCTCSSQAKMLPYSLNCDLGKGSTQTLHIQNVTVRLIPQTGMCHVEVASSENNLLFERLATGMQVSSELSIADGSQSFFVIQIDSSPNELIVFDVGRNPRVTAFG